MGTGTLALDLLTHDHIRVHSVAGTDFVSVATHGIHAHPVGSEFNQVLAASASDSTAFALAGMQPQPPQSFKARNRGRRGQ